MLVAQGYVEVALLPDLTTQEYSQLYALTARSKTNGSQHSLSQAGVGTLMVMHL